MAEDLRDRITNLFQKRVANPLMRRLPIQTLLETTGRKSGQPRRTPLGGSKVGNEFWFVSEFGENSQYVKNIKANPNVRVRLRGRWHDGTAHLVPGRPGMRSSSSSTPCPLTSPSGCRRNCVPPSPRCRIRSRRASVQRSSGGAAVLRWMT